MASGAEDYYLHGGEAAGFWLGAAAADLGLVGVVEPKALRAVLGATDPGTGVALGPSSARKVPGFDLTFRAPKSVSVLWGLADQEVADEVRRAHDAAVLAALRYMEEQAAWSRRGAQGREVVRVDGFVAAGFRHRTSRAGDPLLHTHVVVSNLGRAVDDGRWRTLDGRPLYQHAKTAGYLYKAHLRHELTRRIGVEWGQVRNGCADLAGVPTAVVREFSRRRGEIEQRLAERGASSAKAAHTATLETRKAKDYGVAVGALQADWRQRAAAKALTGEELKGLLDRASVPAHTDVQADRVAEELGSATGLTEHNSTFARRDVAEKAQAKVVLVGDHRQLPEIEAGGIFRGLTTRPSMVELTENRRQHEAWERAALDQLRDGDPAKGIAAFADHGRVTTGATADKVRQRLVDDWLQAHQGRTPGEAGVMLAARRVDVEDLNARARRRLQDAGRLTGQELAAAERDFAVGDRVLCGRNDRRIGVFNGDLGTVTIVDHDARILTVELDRGDQCLELPARYLDAGHLNHAYAMTAHKAQGATVERAWVLGSDACYREWAYVALSRARAGTRLYLVGDPDGSSQVFTAALQTSRANGLAMEHGDPAPAHVRPESRIQADMAQRRLALLGYAIDQTREARRHAEQRLNDARTQLEQQGSGLGRLRRRDETTRLRQDVVRLDGDVSAWQQRLDDLVAERDALVDGTSPVSLERTIGSESQDLQRLAGPEARRRSAAGIDEREDWDIGIA